MPKIDLITGFLGAGKTTFLKRYARYLINNGNNIGILEYDYGAVNVDMMLLQELEGEQCELEMIAASCDRDCLKRRFKTKLVAMGMCGYDRVLVEPSGIFDMDLFFDTLREEPLDKWYSIGNIMTVVDADTQEELTEQEEYILASQAACAGCVILSKLQNVNGERLEAVKSHLQRAAARIRCTDFAPVWLERDWEDLTDADFEQLAGCGYQIADYVKLMAGEDCGFSSVSILEPLIGKAELEDRIREIFLSPDFGKVIRIKGFVCDEEQWYQINAVSDTMTCEKITAGQSAVIIIGEQLNEGAIRNRIPSSFDRKDNRID